MISKVLALFLERLVRKAYFQGFDSLRFIGRRGIVACSKTNDFGRYTRLDRGMPGKHCVGETWRGSIPLPSSGVDMLMMDEIYVSTDVETDGPIPGPYSMLSIGSVAYALSQENGRLERVRLGEFSANLETLPGASSHPEVMDWWAKQPAAWEACRKNLEAPRDAMRRYYEWVSQLPGIKLGNKGDVKNAVFVGYPSGFDFTFVFWYFMSFVVDVRVRNVNTASMFVSFAKWSLKLRMRFCAFVNGSDAMAQNGKRSAEMRKQRKLAKLAAEPPKGTENEAVLQ